MFKKWLLKKFNKNEDQVSSTTAMDDLTWSPEAPLPSLSSDTQVSEADFHESRSEPISNEESKSD
tara:strand:- start:1047 stop:1241 length:195 start_codon:yes stop_codon:yes gene_type:complete